MSKKDKKKRKETLVQKLMDNSDNYNAGEMLAMLAHPTIVNVGLDEEQTRFFSEEVNIRLYNLSKDKNLFLKQLKEQLIFDFGKFEEQHVRDYFEKYKLITSKQFLPKNTPHSIVSKEMMEYVSRVKEDINNNDTFIAQTKNYHLDLTAYHRHFNSKQEPYSVIVKHSKGKERIARKIPRGIYTAFMRNREVIEGYHEMIQETDLLEGFVGDFVGIQGITFKTPGDRSVNSLYKDPFHAMK